jgi:murein DD-endopeptidase MepM/ murein hydrolase activator NlpD
MSTTEIDLGFKWRSPNSTFVYAPDIAVFVANDDGILDLSGDIEEWTMVRNVNALSTFSCTLNNKFRKYDRLIQRMDRVVVFLKRTHWLQCFSGYLNTVPYITVVPGSVSIEASCTLKRIAYTYWDQYSQEAERFFPPYYTPYTRPDGGAAAAAWRLMTEVAHWERDHIWIQKIPQAFLDQAGKLEKRARGAQPDPDVIAAIQPLLDSTGFNGGLTPPNTPPDGTAKPDPKKKEAPHPGKPLPLDSLNPNEHGHGKQGQPTTPAPAPTRDSPFAFFPSANPSCPSRPDPLPCVGGAGPSCHFYTDTYGDARYGGGYHPHAGNDILNPRGATVVAPFDGTITDSTNSLGGNAVHIEGEFGYVYMCHMDAPPPGPFPRQVVAGEGVGQVGNSGDAQGGVCHIHFEWHPHQVLPTDRVIAGTNGAVDPYSYLQKAEGKIADGSGSTASAGSAFNPVWYPSYDAESAQFTGDRAFINDVPLLESINELMQSSLRDFQSAPNGDFVAWYPDKLGIYGKGAAVSIRDIEIKQPFAIMLSDDQLTTHVAVAGNIYNPDPTTHVDPDWIYTHGIVSVQQKEVMKLLLGLDTGKDYKNWGGDWILPRFGMRPLRQEAAMIRAPQWEFMLALHIFMQKWSEQFLTDLQLTFMPEVYPGMRIIIEEHGIALYAESVTHQGSRQEPGFSTTVQVSSPLVHGADGKWHLLPLERKPTVIKDKSEDIPHTPWGKPLP